jgi:transcription initiation factor IIE alpha subunit
MIFKNDEVGKLKCPECAGTMKFDRYIHRHVCTRCGLALTNEEREKIIKQQRGEIYETDPEEEKRKRRKEYLNWWLSEKEK